MRGTVPPARLVLLNLKTLAAREDLRRDMRLSGAFLWSRLRRLVGQGFGPAAGLPPGVPGSPPESDRRRAWRAFAAATLLFLAACGYHVGPQGSLLPKDLRTIAIPQFGNNTVQYKLASYMSEAVTREFISRTRYTVVADPKQADATLYGSIVLYSSGATVSDPTTGRGSGAQVTVQMQIRLIAKDGKVLYTRPNFTFQDRYEISIYPGQYIDESQATLTRLSKDVARSVVSAVLENF